MHYCDNNIFGYLENRVIDSSIQKTAYKSWQYYFVPAHFHKIENKKETMFSIPSKMANKKNPRKRPNTPSKSAIKGFKEKR